MLICCLNFILLIFVVLVFQLKNSFLCVMLVQFYRRVCYYFIRSGNNTLTLCQSWSSTDRRHEKNYECWYLPRMYDFITSLPAEQPHLILLQIKPDYIPKILLQTGCPAKLAFRPQRGSKVAKSAIFRIFLDFSHITAKLFILQ